MSKENSKTEITGKDAIYYAGENIKADTPVVLTDKNDVVSIETSEKKNRKITKKK